VTTEPITTNDDSDVRVFHRAEGWTMGGSQTPEACTSNHRREQAGTPACTQTAAWKVVELYGMGASISFWCDNDLPSEHRHLSTMSPHFENGRIEIEGSTYETADKHMVLFDADGCAFISFYRDGKEISATALLNHQAEDLGATLTHGTAIGQNRQVSSPVSFEDIVDADAGLSPMYRAVVQVEQQEPEQLPIVIGVKAWALLDAEQQRESFNDLLQAYVEVVQHQRDGRPIR